MQHISTGIYAFQCLIGFGLFMLACGIALGIGDRLGSPRKGKSCDRSAVNVDEGAVHG